MRVTTDHKWKNFKCGYEVPARIHAEYDWLDEEEKYNGWLCYRHRWYHVSDFLRIDGNGPLAGEGWNGAHGDSYFSGVVIRLSRDGEMYQIGTYCE